MLTKILVAYSTVLTTVLAGFMVAGSMAVKTQHFDEIDVRRINVREPDGTLRLVISNRARLPGVIVRGKEQPTVDMATPPRLVTLQDGLRGAAALTWAMSMLERGLDADLFEAKMEVKS